LIFLDDPDQVAEILQTLIRSSTDQMLMAYQIGFDLYESATQQFLNKIQDALRVQAPIPIILDKQQIDKDEPQSAGTESMETNQDETSRQSVEESTPTKDKQSLQQEHKDKVNSLVCREILFDMI
jgi:26S proteasome regulatory subunit N2